MANQVLLKEIKKDQKDVLWNKFFLIWDEKSIDDLNFMSLQFTSMVSNLRDNKKNNRITSPFISFANSVWIDRSFGLNPSYKRILEGSYNAKAKEVDFANKADQVIDEVNSWVKNETKGLIKNLLPHGSLYGDTALLFANALYCKGQWDQKFDKTRTRNMNFHLLDEEIAQVPFMTSKRDSRQLYGLFGGYKILSTPYQGSNFSMYFFLPNETDGLPKLVKKLKSNPGFMHQEFGLRKEDVSKLWIPRFKFSFEFEASETIKQMGLKLPFMNVGELTEIVIGGGVERGGLFLSKVFHKSCIEVNEEGT
ncbi:hypothetical protein HYC85_015206 [Camellia sinensis]|uniref:Serpin domain-containing protein n=1 Tax=Camellia sinensis TaxID=4442 RepID=A0A7J7GZY0_CAMSI|nr:hypothetical protein HYC85_015206 [Camellia sinensis]